MKQYFLFLRTFALIVFVHPCCTCKFMSQWCHIIHRAHAQRKINFAGKCGTFGQNDSFAWILRFKAVGDPHFFFGHIAFFDKFLPIVKICKTRNFQKFLSDDGNESLQYNPPLPPSLDSIYKDPRRKSWLQKVVKAPNENRPGHASHDVMWRI